MTHQDDFITNYGKGTQLITWGVAKVVRDVSDDFAHTFDYHVYGNDGVNFAKHEGTITSVSYTHLRAHET